MSADNQPIVVAVCLSKGGIPKIPQPEVTITTTGITGDGHDHDKHNKPTRALSLFDEEILQQLCGEGYDLTPGSIGENVLLRNVHVQQMPLGTILALGDVQIRLEEPRKPCFVLHAVDRRLEADVTGRCGYLASVIKGGTLKPGAPVERIEDRSSC